MKKNEHESFLFKEETHSIIGCAMEVINTLGHGFLEKPYEKALVIELKQKKIPFRQQPGFEISYKGNVVGEYIPDIIVYDKIIVEIKTVERIGDHEIGQMLNYLKVTNLRVGLILNFKHSKLQVERVVR